MNWLSINQAEPVAFERIRFVSELDRSLAGPMVEIGVLPGATQVGLGKRSWYELAEWLGQRGIVGTMAGLYWSHRRTRLDDLTPRVSYLYRVEYEAMALVWMERVEDQVRFEREVLKRFGRPVQMGQAHCFTRQRWSRT